MCFGATFEPIRLPRIYFFQTVTSELFSFFRAVRSLCRCWRRSYAAAELLNGTNTHKQYSAKRLHNLHLRRGGRSVDTPFENVSFESAKTQ